MASLKTELIKLKTRQEKTRQINYEIVGHKALTRHHRVTQKLIEKRARALIISKYASSEAFKLKAAERYKALNKQIKTRQRKSQKLGGVKYSQFRKGVKYSPQLFRYAPQKYTPRRIDISKGFVSGVKVPIIQTREEINNNLTVRQWYNNYAPLMNKTQSNMMNALFMLNKDVAKMGMRDFLDNSRGLDRLLFAGSLGQAIGYTSSNLRQQEVVLKKLFEEAGTDLLDQIARGGDDLDIKQIIAELKEMNADRLKQWFEDEEVDFDDAGSTPKGKKNRSFSNLEIAEDLLRKIKFSFKG